jgi:hypothetical protein
MRGILRTQPQPEEIPMGTHTVHKSTESGNFVVADDKGKILHTFPSEGEAQLQLVAIEQAEEAAQAKAKEDAKASKDEAKAAKADDDKPHVATRHR